MRSMFLSGLMLAALLASGCSTEPKPSPYTGWWRTFASCRDQYAEMDARVDAAGVRDATYFRVPGFPYLRSDRTLASYRHEVKGLDDISEWVRRMREFDQESRDYEMTNLGLGEVELATWRDRFLNCGRMLATLELAEPEDWGKFVERVVPVDEYSRTDRFFGLYPLRASSMRRHIDELADGWRNDYLKPLPPPAAGAPLMLWTARPAEDMSLLAGAAQRMLINALGFPSLVPSEWRALAELYAPDLWLETGGVGDVPASPVLTEQGPSADSTRPAVFYQYTFARFGGKVLPQITYFVWFEGDEAATSRPLDGLIWRVTLDLQLEPLVYESLHASGRDHRWYPVQAMALRDSPEAAEADPAFVAPVAAPDRDASLRIASGSHALRRVVPAELAKASKPAQYELRLYEELYTLPRPGGGTHSLFGPEGYIDGSEGSDPLAVRATGIQRPGVLRQYGHHPIAHVGRRYFDDPWLLDLTFVAPAALQATVTKPVPAPKFIGVE